MDALLLLIVLIYQSIFAKGRSLPWSFGSERVLQLHSRTGFNLVIEKDGTVQGTHLLQNPNALMEITSVNLGIVRIQGLMSGRFLAINEDGYLHSQSNPNDVESFFIQRFHQGYTYYLSWAYKDKGYYIALKKNGQPKAGCRTALGQSAAGFLPRLSRRRRHKN